MRNRLLIIAIILIAFKMLSCVVYHDQINELWVDSIHNPANEEYVVETAFNCGDIPLDQVTQEMFDIRYNKGYTPSQLHDMYMNNECGCPDSTINKQ